MVNHSRELCTCRIGRQPLAVKRHALFHVRAAFLLCIALISISTSLCSAQDAGTQKLPGESNSSSVSAYCGLHSLYTVMKLAGMNVNFNDLVKPDYVDSRVGSRLEQLKKAAENHGLFAVPVQSLTMQILRESPYPIIIHVKAKETSRQYDHYELFLGAEAGKAILYDSSYPVKLEPFHKLKPRWNGTGLVVSTEPIDIHTLFLPAWRQFAVIGILTAAAVILWHCVSQRWLSSFLSLSRRRRFYMSLAQSGLLISIAVVTGTAYHYLDDSGFLAQPDTIAAIQEAHISNFMPKYSVAKTHRLLRDGTVFVDARFQRDFDAGHIEGAINIPPNATVAQRQDALAGISKEARIVTYCQSVSCPYAARVSEALMQDGFYRVGLFRGGWEEWQAYNTD